MRILFSATPAYGHVLPLLPLVAAAVSSGHDVGFMTSEGFRTETVAELPPAARFLPAGAMPMEFSMDAARRTGADVFAPTPAVIGEIFGGSRLDMGRADALARVDDFRPDVVVGEAFDTLGPLVAAAAGVPWHRTGVGPGLPTVIDQAIRTTAAAHVGAALPDPIDYIDPCPALLQDPAFRSDVPVVPMRASAHRRPESAPLELAPFGDPARPTVLLTLGTIFSDPDLLDAALGALAAARVNVIATLGSSLRYGAADAMAPKETDSLRVVGFVPLAQLLEHAELVVNVAGAGTVLGTLAAARPMVLWPQGADQPVNAARAEAAGVAVVVDAASDLTAATSTVLESDSYRDRARQIAEENAAKPSAADVVEGWRAR